MTIARVLSLLTASSLGLLTATSLVPWSRLGLPPGNPPTKSAALPVLLTIEDLAGDPWPWPRLDLTLALRAVSPYRPHPVGLLLPLDAPDVFEPVQDDQLSRALGAFESPVLPAAALPPLPQTQKITLPEIPHQGSIQTLRSAESFLAPQERLQKNAAVAAWKVTPEADGLLGRLPMVFQQQGVVIPSWLLVMYAQEVEADLSHSELRGRKLILRDSQNRDVQTIPLDLRGSIPVDWSSPEPAFTKMEIRGVVLAAEQERIGVRPYFDLSTLSKRPVILAGALPEVDPAIDSPWGKSTVSEAVVRAWQGLAQGPRPVLHPPSWLIVAVLFAGAALGLYRDRQWRICLMESLVLAGAVYSLGWLAAKFGGYSGALPLAIGAAVATFLASPFASWLEKSYVR